MRLKRFEEKDSGLVFHCTHCDFEVEECSYCGKALDDIDYVKCVKFKEKYKGKEFFDFRHLCYDCKDERFDDEDLIS